MFKREVIVVNCSFHYVRFRKGYCNNVNEYTVLSYLSPNMGVYVFRGALIYEKHVL